MIEILRHSIQDLSVYFDKEDYKRVSNKAADILDPALGFSGAQVGAAKSLAFHIITEGFVNIKTEEDRKIMTSKHFPDPEMNKQIVDAILANKKLLPVLLGIHPELDKRIQKELSNEPLQEKT